MPEAELDLRLHRLLFFSDGVYAIAVTLLAVELVLPETTAELHGRDLLRSLLESWPRVLAFLTSFLFIANFWAGHNILFHHVRRFDGGLMWLALLQLLCVAFMPFPTSVVGEHVSDPVAQQFYFGSLLVTGLVMWALWWYMSSGHRSVDRDLSARAIRRHHLISSGVPASILLLMGLVALGVGRFVNPLLLAYLVAFGYVVLGVLEHRESLPAEVEEPGGSDDT
jgi:uncharacterized membrane protein